MEIFGDPDWGEIMATYLGLLLLGVMFTAFSVFARAEDIDVLVTDSAFAEGEKVAALGMELIIADMEPALKVNESRVQGG